MAVEPAMFLFEVVVESVKPLCESRQLVIRSDFADIFSLELKDPKQMNIVMPEPPPLPPDPPGKKKKAPKPKPKKGKKGAIELPPPEPVIQSGQSVLFTSTPEYLIQNMKKCPLELSLWSKEDNLSLIGSNVIPWDPIFLKYLELICNCEDPPPVTLNEEYNIFEEGQAKLMAKLGIQIKLSYLKDKVTTSFRTLSEDPTIKKYLYTGINSKTTSYICTMKTTDEAFIENSNKIENNFVQDKPASKVVYANYKNAPGANLTFFTDGDYCCMNRADKPPESIYKSPETMPDIDTIVDYVRQIIVSCNDNMRMLTPRETIRPRIKATDIDRLCYCKETKWPDGELAKRFKKEAQSEACPMCINAGGKPEGSRAATFDIANIRGPCGRPDCRIARDMRAYIENLLEEDNQDVNMDDIIGPCGSKTCLLAEKIQEFLKHEGDFKTGTTVEGLSTQCACVQKMQSALVAKKSCATVCSKDCDDSDSSASKCAGPSCPYEKKPKQVYNVYYCTVEHDFDKGSLPTSTPPASVPGDPESKPSKYRFCHSECPSLKAMERPTCSQSTCATTLTDKSKEHKECENPTCPHIRDFPPSPADSNIEMAFDEIHNMCCVKTCDAADAVKEFIVEGVMHKKSKLVDDDEDPCYCDCVCNLKFSRKTTYCAVCGGYECLGDDMKDQPPFAIPYPCPVYHKLYDKKYIKVQSPWPDEEEQPKKPPSKALSAKSSRSTSSKFTVSRDALDRSSRSRRESKVQKEAPKEKKQKVPKDEAKKQIGKYTVEKKESPPGGEKKIESKYPYPPVPKHMGWNWTADDIPGMKPRPKWKPGAANKILVRRYRAMREGMDSILKKKRAMLGRKKKIEMKPTLVVKKRDGEYTVQMEVFKQYSKERLVYQYPYDEKPPLIYTIGKTEDEKRKIQIQRDKRERRETRRKSRLLQSTFRDRCQEICLKAYNQAMGILPLPDPNSPDCPCNPEYPQLSPPIDSCSCSDDETISSSDTDNDEWTIEFTPPAARWDAKAKHPPTLAENECQYTYLDYKVKLLDKQGNQVPRYFKGPDGKQECSDLGGFWGPGHEWMEISKDGYIGPDNRWVPMNFTGPDGMFYSAEEGFFTDANGQMWKIGVDGYVDKDLKWAWYSKRRPGKSKSTLVSTNATQRTAARVNDKTGKDKGDEKGKAGAKGAQKPDKKPALKHNNDNKEKSKKTVSYSGRAKAPVVVNLAVNRNRHYSPRSPEPSHMRVDPKKLMKYKEIMKDLEIYDSLCELKPPTKTNRASNTPRKKISPFTLDKLSPVRNSPIPMVDSSVHRTNTTCSYSNNLKHREQHEC